MKKNITKKILLFLLLLSAGAVSSCSSAMPEANGLIDTGYLFHLNTPAEANLFNDEGTGAMLSFNPDIFHNQSVGGLNLSPPTGLNKEAKMITLLTNNLLKKWLSGSKVVISVYVPKGCNLNRVGVYLTTTATNNNWIDYSGNSSIQEGWNELLIPMTTPMRNLTKYIGSTTNVNIGLTFYNQVSGVNNKLNTSITLGGLAVQ